MKKILFAVLLTAAFLINTNLSSAETVSYIPENPEKALIIIHGYGQDGSKMQWMTDILQKELPDTAFYYPTAPNKAPYHGYQWFVIPAFGAEMSEMKLNSRMLADAVDNVVVLHDLIDEIHNTQGISYEKIDISGFSQGGLMAVLAGLTNSNHIGRVVSLSGVPLVLTKHFDADMIASRPDILLVQGTNDNVIPSDSIVLTQKTLETLGLKPEIVEIRGMGHQITPLAIKWLIEFIQKNNHKT